jgi:molybdopterin converting factor subunit 1
MTLHLLYFAAVRELMGISEEMLAVPDHVRHVADVAAFLEHARPQLKGRLQGVRLALNETFADGPEALQNGDCIALIPPVAGG